jgi:hypothetical protein
MQWCEARVEEMPMASSPSLYERLGGVYSIATVTDDFIIIVFPPQASSTSSRKWSAGPAVGLKSTPAVP